MLSVVAYFNPGWLPEDGGELDMYREDELEPFLRVTPAFGTLVVFLSEELPHEVRAANRHRYSIAGWYRVNNSLGSQIDPPRCSVSIICNAEMIGSLSFRGAMALPLTES